MILPIQGVMLDDSSPAGTIEPAEPFPQPLAIPAGDDVTIRMTVIDRARAAVDVTGGAFYFAARLHPYDVLPILFRLGEITEPGTGGAVTFALPGDYTAELPPGTYRYDIHYVDGDEKRWQIVPASDLTLGESVGRPDDPITPADPVEP